MAYGEIPVQTATGIAGADLSAKRYYAVSLDTDGNAVLCAAGKGAVGILRAGNIKGQACSFMVLGEALAIYGGAVAAGDNLSSDANGKLIKATTGAVVGVARESGADGEIHTIILRATNN